MNTAVKLTAAGLAITEVAVRLQLAVPQNRRPVAMRVAMGLRQR